MVHSENTRSSMAQARFNRVNFNNTRFSLEDLQQYDRRLLARPISLRSIRSWTLVSSTVHARSNSARYVAFRRSLGEI